MARIGVYTMGNDLYVDWTLAFLQSFRESNPATELIFIPFDDPIDRIARLASKYDFKLFDDAPLLRRLERVGTALFPHSPFQAKCFRKFAAFQGPFDYFLYLDADIVVLSVVEEWLQRIVASGVDFAFFDTSPEWVYPNAEFKAHMVREYNARCFAAGAFASRSGLISVGEVEGLIPIHASIKSGLSGAGDQPYMNYMIDTKRLKVAAAGEVIPEFGPPCWAGQTLDPGPGEESENAYARAFVRGKSLPFLHWAGFKCQNSIPNVGFFRHYRLAAESSWFRRRTWLRRFERRTPADADLP
jgi:hypothetical protein